MDFPASHPKRPGLYLERLQQLILNQLFSQHADASQLLVSDDEQFATLSNTAEIRSVLEGSQRGLMHVSQKRETLNLHL